MKTADYYFHNTTKMRELQPVLCVVAGPNGSGKTSTTEKLLANEWTADSLYINPDNIAQEEFGDWNTLTHRAKPLSGSPHGESELRYNGLAHWGLTPFPWEKWDGSCEGVTALYQRRGTAISSSRYT